MRLFLVVLVIEAALLAAQTPNSYGVCNQAAKPSCNNGFRPVCGFKTSGLPVTYPTVCQACSSAKTIAYLEGDCQLHLRNCSGDGPKRKDCFQGRLKLRSLCGFFSNGTFENVKNFKTPYSHIVDRSCPVGEAVSSLQEVTDEPSYVYCSTIIRDSKCHAQVEPTCGIPLTGLPKDYRNPCIACDEGTVFAYLPGKCEQLVKHCNPNRIDCDRVRAPPVQSCGFQIGRRPTDMNNSMCCKGTTYEHSLPMKCPTYPERHCPTLKEWSCPRDLDWVCGISKNGKRWTYINDCSACSLSQVTKYTYGKCT